MKATVKYTLTEHEDDNAKTVLHVVSHHHIILCDPSRDCVQTIDENSIVRVNGVPLPTVLEDFKVTDESEAEDAHSTKLLTISTLPPSGPPLIAKKHKRNLHNILINVAVINPDMVRLEETKRSLEKDMAEDADVDYLVTFADVFNKIYTHDFDAAQSSLDRLFDIVYHRNTSNHHYYLLKTLNVSTIFHFLP